LLNLAGILDRDANEGTEMMSFAAMEALTAGALTAEAMAA